MRNYWTDKSRVKKYVDLLIKEVAILCKSDYATIQVLLETEILKRPFTPEEIDLLVRVSEEEIIAYARTIHAQITHGGGLW